MKPRYLLIHNNADSFEVREFATHQEIVDAYPVWHHRDNVRYYFRCKATYKQGKQAKKYENFTIKLLKT